ncbi:MAG: dienelactone hydrolase family protein [Kovacikia sp.]
MDGISTQDRQEHLVSVCAGSVNLEGNLVIPAGAQGIVLFAHGSGSSRHSPRNRYVAAVLQQEGLATLLLDLLTAKEEVIDLQTRHLRFDIGLLATRLIGATDWLRQAPTTQQLRIGYFGASTGSAAALIAATRRPHDVDAIVSRGGRPDLAGSALTLVQAPTLLIVGSKDISVIGMNQDALALLSQASAKQLERIPGATHLFEEPGTLEQVAVLASQWFKRYLIRSSKGLNTIEEDRL